MKPLRLALCTLAALLPAATAGAYWDSDGSGRGSAATATMPVAAAPTASAVGRFVTLSWAQSSFLGNPLGSYAGGGYTVARSAEGAVTPAAPDAGCPGTVRGSGASVQCVESDVPYGRWRYTVTPVLGSFTGEESVKSASVAVATAAPVLGSVTALNPAAGATTGDIRVNWEPVTNATGYNVYRRTGGAFDPSAPLNGTTPVTATSFTDPGTDLAGGTSYRYVVRALAGWPAAESASSEELAATAIARPPAPTGVTATAVTDADVSVRWSAAAGAGGYNVYRRTAAGAYDLGAPLNGATPVGDTHWLDATAVDGATYRYRLRSVVIGAGGVQVESDDSVEPAAVTADGSAPSPPVSVSVTAGGPVVGTTSCGVVAGTRYINAAGQASVGVSATAAAFEPGQRVVFSATTPASTPVTATVAAGATTVGTTLNLSSLLAGNLTLTARILDAAGNASAALGPSNPVLKDGIAPPLSASYSSGPLGSDPRITGSSECGARIVATKTAGGNAGATFTTSIASGSSYNLAVEGPLLGLGSVAYSVTATDMAGNTGVPVTTG